MFLFNSPGNATDVNSALQLASRRTGVDLGYLKTTARRESGLNPNAKAATSSASGLFQFVERTWLSVLKQTGASHGYAKFAEKIEPAAGGGYRVSDAAARKAILELREDPKAAALMAGELTTRNAGELRTALGRQASEGELYAAHFLGAQGAAELVRLAETAPGSPAAERFPAAAAANRSIFYKDGRPRSAADVYSTLVSGYDATPAVPANATYLAFAPGRAREDHVFHGLFTTSGAGLGPLGKSVAGFWSGFPGSAPAYGLTEDPGSLIIEATGAQGGARPETGVEAAAMPTEEAESSEGAAARWTAADSTRRYGQWKDDPSLRVP